MTDTPIRDTVVSLFLDLNLTDNPGTWTHRNGRPVTPDELRLALSATRAELQAVQDLSQLALDHSTEHAEAHKRILEIAAPYFAQLPEGSIMRDVLPLLTPDDRAEFDRLTDLVAPDGTIVMPHGITPLRPLADHVAHNFALATPEYGLRGDHDENPFTEAEFTPDVTASELIHEYGRALDRLDAIPDGTGVPVPAAATLIDADGREVFALLDTVTEPDEQTTAVLVALAEAVALEKAAAEARARAVALLVAFEQPDDH